MPVTREAYQKFVQKMLSVKARVRKLSALLHQKKNAQELDKIRKSIKNI